MANSGDTYAIDELRIINDDLIKIANRRMYVLEKNDYDFFAYDYAQRYIKDMGGKRRFYTSKKLDVADLYNNILNANYFVQSPTSLLSWQKSNEKKTFDWLESALYKDGTKKTITNFRRAKERKNFLRFIGSDAGKSFIDIFGTSKGGVEYLLKARQKNSVAKITRYINKYFSGKMLFDELADSLGVEL